MKLRRLILGVVLAVVGLNACLADETKPADPFDSLVAATSTLADMAGQLKPASNNVTVKQETVDRKKAELAEAEAAIVRRVGERLGDLAEQIESGKNLEDEDRARLIETARDAVAPLQEDRSDGNA